METMEPGGSFSWEALLLVISGPLAVLAWLGVLYLLFRLLSRLWRKRSRVATGALGSGPAVRTALEGAQALLPTPPARPECDAPVLEAGVVPAEPPGFPGETSGRDVGVPAPGGDDLRSDRSPKQTPPAALAPAVDEMVLHLPPAQIETAPPRSAETPRRAFVAREWFRRIGSVARRVHVPRAWVVALLLLLILATGAVFRFVGLDWDSGQHLHPDERFITMVADRIRPASSLAEYFDTERSPLNPFSEGSYTYGMLPLFLTRYVAEWTGRTGYDQIVLVGRVLSGLFDLAAVALLFLLGTWLYDSRVGLLSAALAATAVLSIQLAHFFAVDSFGTVFVVGAFCLAVRAMDRGHWWLYASFGALVGLAMSCKITTAPLAGLIAAVSVVRLAGVWHRPAERSRVLRQELIKCLAAVLMAGLLFRVCQPYAFQGPGFWDLRFNQRWLDIIREVRSQVTGRAEWPPNHHWTDRPMLTFAWQNLVLWGLGLPLGLAATAGFLWAAWRCWKAPNGEWQRHLLPVLWVGGYFAWQNLQFWRYMRYFVPILPLAILLAARLLIALVDLVRGRAGKASGQRGSWLPRALAVGALVAVVAGTWCYAAAFVQIYTRAHTRVQASRWILQNVPGPLNVIVQTDAGVRQYPLTVQPSHTFSVGGSWQGAFRPAASGEVVAITTKYVQGLEGAADSASVGISLTRREGDAAPLVSVSAVISLAPDAVDQRFSVPPVAVEQGETYLVNLEVREGGPFSLLGSRLAMETAWDDALPLRVDNADPLGGIYQTLDLRLFEADTEVKRENMVAVLEQADLVVISSNRAYDAMPRLPLRYPLTLAYYQALLDCPTRMIVDCAYPAVVPRRGRLGFDLVATFESNPGLGRLTFSDQRAEEAFTVYDHPKVLLLRKTAGFDVSQVRAILESVDLTQVIEQGPVQSTRAPTALGLPADRWAEQTQGGTWSAMFDPDGPLNRYQGLAVLGWYALVLVLSWTVFPLVWLAFRGLPDRGYPLSRVIALLAVGWLAWMLASLRVLPFTRLVLWLCALALAMVSGLLVRAHRREIGLFLRTRWRLVLVSEGLFLALFVLLLAVRWHNPDLWQPWRGGEKPMDMAYFNAVLRSTSFPPYDPWMAGNMLNYYYYGYVLVSVPTKMLGIVPSIAYNLALPTWYAMTGIGAFSAAFNLVAANRTSRRRAYLAGVVAVVLVVLLGNLFQVRVIWDRLVEVGAPENLRLPWYREIGEAFRGLRAVPAGKAPLVSEDLGRWYFSASRAILHFREGTPITEFPLFTFLYADLHPHMMDMPVMLAALGWMLSLVLGPQALSVGAWLLGGLVIGATYPTHSWDLVTMIALGMTALGYRVWLKRRHLSRDSLAAFAGRSALLLALAVGLYAPFHRWFGSDYAAAELWQGPRTPLTDYLTVHGLFLFLLVTFLAVRSAGWVLARWNAFFYTRLGVLLPRLRRVWWRVLAGLALSLCVAAWCWLHDYHALVPGVVVLLWAATLLLAGRRSVPERVMLTLVASGAGLTCLVELFTLRGDVGRSNTVFKFYIQVWLLFSVAAGAATAWLLPHLARWRRRRLWLAGLVLLAASAATYPLLAVPARTEDRWPELGGLPRTLDGMAYMLGEGPDRPAIYRDEGRPLNLAADYAAIRWLQDHAVGSPVIVEGNTPEYRWGSRFSIYTGMPSVVGWSWHLRQHNSVVPGVVVEQRIERVRDFYSTSSLSEAAAFLRRYGVGYVVVGDLERAYYAAEGLAKFPRMVAEGLLLVAYQSGPAEAGVTLYRAASGP